jgi:uncharacterized membrane protein
MRIDLIAHIVAGAVSLVSGFIALYVAKGAGLHRKSGLVFVYAMLAMSVIGALIAAIRDVAPMANVPAGVLTAYLVITALVTVRRPSGWSPRFDVALTLVALSVAAADLTFGIRAVTSPNPKNHWMLIPFSIFSSVAMLATVGDIRTMRAGGLRGTARIARHLWRMCFALFIATSSFFLGQAKVIPKPIRIVPLLALPVVAVLVTMLYWLWRVRVQRTLRAMVVRGAPDSNLKVSVSERLASV